MRVVVSTLLVAAVVVGSTDDAHRAEVEAYRAYSPPCAFTEYVTCPLPPQQNWLDVAIEAGE